MLTRSPLVGLVVRQEMQVNFIILIGKNNVIITCISSGPPGRNTEIELEMQETVKQREGRARRGRESSGEREKKENWVERATDCGVV